MPLQILLWSKRSFLALRHHVAPLLRLHYRSFYNSSGFECTHSYVNRNTFSSLRTYVPPSYLEVAVQFYVSVCTSEMNTWGYHGNHNLFVREMHR